MQNTPPENPRAKLLKTCDELERALSSAGGPMSLLAARPFLVDLVRGVRTLGARVSELEDKHVPGCQCDYCSDDRANGRL